jgi:hypothetical protein
MPQPSDPIAPAANRLPPRIKTKAVHTAFSIIVLVLVAILFIVIYYTIYHIVLSMKMMKRFLNVSKQGKAI